MSETLEARTLLTNLTVTTALDIVDAGDGEMSLREAIHEANAMTGYDTITFNISGGTSHTIALAGQPLPTITDAVEIDGSAQTITIDSTTVANHYVMKIDGGGAAGSHVHDLSFADTRYAITATDTNTVTFEDINADWDGAGRVGDGMLINGGSGHAILNSSVSNRSKGIKLINVTQSTIAQNVGHNTSVGDQDANGGVSGDNDYIANNFSDSNIALSINGSLGNNEIIGNNLSNSDVGIDVRNGQGNVVRDNDLSNSSLNTANAAMRIWDDTQITIAGNDFSNSRRGIEFHDFDDIVITPTGVLAPTLAPGQTWLPIDVDLSSV